MSKQRRCSSCDEQIPAKLENYLGMSPTVCLNCYLAAVRELRKDEKRSYYGLEEIDV